MSKNNLPVSVVISTRKIDDKYVEHVKKMFNHPKTQILIYENDGIPLTRIYNQGFNESENDIVVFMHDDLVLETPDITPKINELFKKNSEYGIIGLAGTTNLKSGMWWEDRESMYGIVNHINEGKKHTNFYSNTRFNDKVKDVVIVDGLFFMFINKELNTDLMKSSRDSIFMTFHFVYPIL